MSVAFSGTTTAPLTFDQDLVETGYQFVKRGQEFEKDIIDKTNDAIRAGETVCEITKWVEKPMNIIVASSDQGRVDKTTVVSNKFHLSAF